MSEKRASTNHPIYKFLAERWSLYAFQDRPVSKADLRSLFKAAWWSASSYNEQPWRYLIATQANSEQFQQLLSCLIEGNQIWAKNLQVLALGIASLKFTSNHEDNRAAIHDLGLATGNLVVEATARGICMHQMIGILLDRARNLFDISKGFEAWMGIAIGYPGEQISDVLIMFISGLAVAILSLSKLRLSQPPLCIVLPKTISQALTGGSKMRIFIAGATGVISRPILTQILTRGHDVVALTRFQEKAQSLAAQGIEPAIADYSTQIWLKQLSPMLNRKW